MHVCGFFCVFFTFFHRSFLNVLFHDLLWKELCIILSAFCFIFSLPFPDSRSMILFLTFSLVHYYAPQILRCLPSYFHILCL